MFSAYGVLFKQKANDMRMWRNWQTRWIQVPVKAISYGFKSLHPHHKETIILIRKISVLWLFYCLNRVFLPFFWHIFEKIRLVGIVFVLASFFSFYPLKIKSFTLYPFRSF